MEKIVQELTNRLYADPELGPGYMLRGDCEHLARRVLTGLTVEWGVRYPSGAVESYVENEAGARRFALATDDLRPDLPTLVVRKVVTPWEVVD